MSKLEYKLDMHGDKPLDAHWNQRPNDALHLARWFGKEAETFFNWQVVDLNMPIEDMDDSPILYISGNQALSFTPPEDAKLKEFVEAGGMILANADCGSANFTNSVKTLGSKLFGYLWRELPADHLIYTNQNFPAKDWHIKPQLMGLSNGARELMLLIPQSDLGRAWQLQMFHTRTELSQLGANIYLYAAEKHNLKHAFEGCVVRPDPNVKAARSMRLARLRYNGTWDPEPGGWRRMAAILHNQQKLDLSVETIDLGARKLADPDGKLSAPDAKAVRDAALKRITSDELAATGGEPAKFQALIDAKVKQILSERKKAPSSGFHVAHLTGTGKLVLNDLQRREIKKYIDEGGTLLIDAAGGSTEFADSAEAELAAIFGGAAKQLSAALPIEHPLFGAIQPPLQTVTYRAFAQRTVGRTKIPMLHGIVIDGRLAVIYSRYDLSAGLVGQPVDGITGYEPASATALMSRFILFAMRL